MNGSRGVVVGFRYYPGPAPPQIPEYGVVEFPCYTGGAVFHGDGCEKWDPVPIADALGMRGRTPHGSGFR